MCFLETGSTFHVCSGLNKAENEEKWSINFITICALVQKKIPYPSTILFFMKNGLQKYKARNQKWSATLADIHTIGNLIPGPVYKQGCRLN